MSQPLNIVWMIFWAFGIFVGFTIAMMAAAAYIGLYIFVPCLPNMGRPLKLVHKGMLIPYFASQNFMEARNPLKGFEHMYEGTAPHSVQ